MEFHNNMTAMMKVSHKSHESIIRIVCGELGHADKADEFVTRLLTTSLKSAKAKKDPNKPKKPKSAYMFFCADARTDIQKENPQMKMVDVAKILGAKWRELNDTDRQKYVEMNAEEKLRLEA